MSNRSSLNWQVLDLINDLIAERGVSKTELVELSGIKRNTLFVKLRGETALTTDDIARLAEALGADPELILRKAWVGCTEEFASAPENGHIIGVDVEFESTALYEEGTMILGPWGFKAIDSKGVTMNADTQSVGSVGCIPSEQFVNRTPTPGEKINGTIVLDVNDTSGILVFNNMWEWEYPA